MSVPTVMSMVSVLPAFTEILTIALLYVMVIIDLKTMAIVVLMTVIFVFAVLAIMVAT